MRISRRLKTLGIFLILWLVTSCLSTPVKIDKLENFKDQYYEIEKDATEEEVYQHTIVTGKKEINYLKKYIEILINRIVSADGKRIKVIDLRGKKK